MSESQLLVVIAASAVVVASSVAVIAWCAVSSRRSIRNLEARAASLFDSWQPVAEETSKAVRDFAEQSGELLSRLNSLSAVLHQQALQGGSLLNDLAQAAQRNISEVEAAVRDILGRVNATSATLERAVHLPATKARAFVQGVSAALRHLARGRRRSPDRISTDEEMFI